MTTQPASAPSRTSDAESRPAKPMRADARRNYERLLAAGRDVLTARGSEASMEEIAKAADVGVGTLYRHFPRRIDLVEAVYREDVDGLTTLAGQLAESAGPWEGLVEWLQAFVRYAQSKRVFLTELHEAFEKNPNFKLDSRDKIATAAATVLRRAQQAGVARSDIDESDLMQLVGGMCMARASSMPQNERLLRLVLDGIQQVDQPAAG